MTAKTAKTVRCAIYTRVSTDQGLEQDFNSLDAQYEASRAYIRSQAHAGWSLACARYDDGGFSGGSMVRPALQRLLADVRAGKIDVIVVYKVDRLTRSLADFAKLVELFDAHGVSFVSVTQQFNTTTSMGRLTLNVLLSFAQFEREVTSERIRDKIAASKRKGLWVGGMVPMGYRVKERKVVVNKVEVEQVRTIFRLYLEFGSLNRLLAELRRRKMVTRLRRLSSGRTVGGIPFARGSLGHLLRNRFYIGEVVYKGEILPSNHPPILNRDLFDAVQAKLAGQNNEPSPARRAASEAPLIGRIFDDRGNRMSPSHTRKRGITYRYYISAPLLQGQPERAGMIRRVPAVEIEKIVADALRREIGPTQTAHGDERLLNDHVSRVEVHPNKLMVDIKALQHPSSTDRKSNRRTLQVPWKKPPSKRRREIIPPTSSNGKDFRPIRIETRATLIAAIAQGRTWLNELVTGTIIDVDAIAARERCSVRKVNMAISLAFLAPDLVKAAVDGRLPRGIGVTRLYDPPAEWSRQYLQLGLAQT
jgi:DNA invertase Pin-like site-specific DNA recombinase